MIWYTLHPSQDSNWKNANFLFSRWWFCWYGWAKQEHSEEYYSQSIWAYELVIADQFSLFEVNMICLQARRIQRKCFLVISTSRVTSQRYVAEAVNFIRPSCSLRPVARVFLAERISHRFHGAVLQLGFRLYERRKKFQYLWIYGIGGLVFV